MVKVSQIKYQSIDAIEITNGEVELIVVVGVGPRIMHFGLKGKENMFYSKDSDFLNKADCYKFYGGHRLWHAPEHEEKSYQPDNIPCEYEITENGVITSTFEVENKIQRVMEIEMKDNGKVKVEHQIINRNNFDIKVASWAITQLRGDGMALMPLDNTKTGLLPNKSLVFWDYTNMADKRLQFLSDQILIKHDSKNENAFKIGSYIPQGFLSYFLDGDLFIKEFDVADKSYEHADFGCNAEIYANDKFIELESLTPLRTIAPHECVGHREVWQIFKKVQCPVLNQSSSVDMKDYVND